MSYNILFRPLYQVSLIMTNAPIRPCDRHDFPGKRHQGNGKSVSGSRSFAETCHPT